MRSLIAILAMFMSMSLVATAPASADAPWSRTVLLDATIPDSCDFDAKRIPAGCFAEPGTRVAVTPSGVVVVAWAAANFRIKAAVGNRHGHFGQTRVLGTGLRPSVAVDRDGAAVVAWSDSGRLRFARLRAGATRFGDSASLVARSTKQGDDFVHLLARPAGGAVAVYESAFRTGMGVYRTRLGAVEIGRSGAPQAPRVIGRGGIRDASATTAGDIVVCCRESARSPVIGQPQPQDPLGIFVRRAGSGDWSVLEHQLAPGTNAESLAADRDTIMLGTVDAVRAGDAGTLGRPGILRGPLAGPFGAPQPAFVKQPGKAFGPVVAIDGSSRSVLAYQEKDTASAFSRSAPLYAVSAKPGAALGATRTTLDRAKVDEPLVEPLGAGAIVAWDRGTSWGVALERAGGFRHVAAPAGGPGELGKDAITNRALATAGPYAVLAWEDRRGGIRASVARLVP